MLLIELLDELISDNKVNYFHVDFEDKGYQRSYVRQSFIPHLKPQAVKRYIPLHVLCLDCDYVKYFVADYYVSARSAFIKVYTDVSDESVK